MNGSRGKLEWFGGNQDELNMYHMFVDLAHVWDDLVDKDTGEIYLKDVNLSTGQVEKQDVPSQPVPDKERQEAIDYLNNAVKDFRIDEILAERGYDVNDIISNLASAENKEEFDKIINKLLRLLC